MEADLVKLNKNLLGSGRMRTCKDEYEKLKTDEERFSYTLGLLEEYEMTPKIETEEKNRESSVKYRKAGSELYVSSRCEKKRDEILELYTKSVAFAEPNSPELALAFGNRSALLFNARLYDHCLLDIDRALALDCPASLRSKLLSRRVNCEAAAAFSRDKTNQDINRLTDEVQTTSFEGSTELAGVKKPLTKNIGPQRQMFDEETFRPEAPNDNPEIPGISSALAITHNPQFGRHIVSTRQIFPGEVLGVQNGYATVLAPDHFYTHCSNCLRQTWSAVPCEHCPHALYCNVTCRNQAWKNHHDVECRVVGALLRFEINLLGLMSLRLLIKAVKEAGNFRSLKTKIQAVDLWPDPRTKGFTGEPPILNENDYSSVYALEGNTEKRSIPDLFGRSFNAVYIVYCVATMTNFFEEKVLPGIDNLRKNQWSIFVGGLVTRHQQIIPSNVHAVVETKGLLTPERGASMIPFLSLFNHSCDSMITRIHYGTKVVLYAAQTIGEGVQVYDNYGMHYAVEPLHSRRQRLQRQYYFHCECTACLENWPIFDDIPSWKEKGLNREDSLKLSKSLNNFQKYVDLATNGSVEDNLGIIKDLELMIKTLFNHVDLPCREVNEVVETLKRIYALLSTRFQSLSEDVDKIDGN